MWALITDVWETNVFRRLTRRFENTLLELSVLRNEAITRRDWLMSLDQKNRDFEHVFEAWVTSFLKWEERVKNQLKKLSQHEAELGRVPDISPEEREAEIRKDKLGGYRLLLDKKINIFKHLLTNRLS